MQCISTIRENVLLSALQQPTAFVNRQAYLSEMKFYQITVVGFMIACVCGCSIAPETGKSNDLEGIPLLKNTVLGIKSGYFKLVWPNGSLARLDHLCNGKAEGTILFFHKNGNIDAYTEYRMDTVQLDISFDLDGNPSHAVFERKAYILTQHRKSYPGQVLVGIETLPDSFSGHISIPARVANGLRFVEKNCQNVSETNWSEVLVNKCDN